MHPSLKICLVPMLAVCLIICAFTPPKVSGKVKTEASTGKNHNLTTYVYDTAGRLVYIAHEPDSMSDISITYDHDSITYLYARLSGKIDKQYILNARGYVAKLNGKGTFTYDADGYLTATEGLRRTAPAAYTISNGDMVHQEGGNSREPIWTATDYTYYHKPDYRDYGMGYLGKSSTHLKKTMTYTRPGGKATHEYTYTFDEKGRVKTETCIFNYGNTGSHATDTHSQWTNTYTYTD